MTRAHLLRAAQYLEEYPCRHAGTHTGLCHAFESTASRRSRDSWERDYDRVERYLSAVGGSMNWTGFFWSLDDDGQEDRLTFLAFMLTWLEDCRGTPA
jgi:hypothetical protein